MIFNRDAEDAMAGRSPYDARYSATISAQITPAYLDWSAQPKICRCRGLSFPYPFRFWS